MTYTPLVRNWNPSPNYDSRAGSNVRLIVLHTTEDSPIGSGNAMTLSALTSFFANQTSQVSSHVGIDDTVGQVNEFVSRGNSAWTAENANKVAIQAEMCAISSWSNATWLGHPNILANCAQWIYEESRYFGIPLVKLTPAQAQGTGTGICQHRDLGVWGGNHPDCGDGFPIDSVIQMATTIGSTNNGSANNGSDSGAITVPKKITSKQSARRMLELSQVTPGALQQELMGADVGIEKLAVYLSGQIEFDVADRIVDASISRTMKVSSTLSITINDYDRAVLNSGYLYNKLDVQVDGLWFRLTGVDKQGNNLILTFEDREVAILRTYTSWKVASRENATRAEFILNLIREVKEFQIPVVIPQLHTKQLLQTYDGDPKGVDATLYKRKGIPKDYQGTSYVTGNPHKSWIDIIRKNKLVGRDDNPLNDEQLANANIIIGVGEDMGVSRKLQWSAVMAAMAMSNLTNDPLVGDGFFDIMLHQLNIVITKGNIDFLNAWAHKEGIYIKNIDTYNLLGTTLPEGDSWGTNPPINVQAYSTAAFGIQGHVDMLNQSNFTHVKAALASGDPESLRNDVPTQDEFWNWSGNNYRWPTIGMASTPVITSGPNGKNPIPSSSSHIKQSQTGDKGLGLFHFTQGSSEDRTKPETSARMYYNQAKKTDALDPHVSLNDLIGITLKTHSKQFSQYQGKANAILHAYGITGGMSAAEDFLSSGQQAHQTLGAGGQFYYYRGNIENRLGQKIRKPENSWDCIQRLAGDVNWMAFFVSGTFYYMSQDDLIKQQPGITMNEFTEGIVSVDGSFYEHKETATMNIVADVGRWIVPPGRVVVVEEMGPWNGRWLVADYERSLFDLQATITLEREQPALPEPNPKGGNKTDVKQTWVPQPAPTKTGKNYNPKVKGNKGELAQSLLDHWGKQWGDDSREQTEHAQLITTANGGWLHPQGGNPAQAQIDDRVLKVLLWLIEDQGYSLGTSAICTDHPPDPHGHSAGLCVDIDRINGIYIKDAPSTSFDITYEVAKKLHNLSGDLMPRQLITGGCGNARDDRLRALTIPQPPGEYYGEGVMAQHCNHIHVGY